MYPRSCRGLFEDDICAKGTVHVAGDALEIVGRQKVP